MIVDTNILLRAMVDDDDREGRLARRRLAESPELIVPTVVFCEFVWVSVRTYKSPRNAVAAAIRLLVADLRTVCDRQAFEAGLAMMDAGGDFADGVIAFEGRRLGGGRFVTFDRKAARLLGAAGVETELLTAAD